MKRTVSIKPLQFESLYSVQGNQTSEKCFSSSLKTKPSSSKSITQKLRSQKENFAVDLKKGVHGSSGYKDSYFRSSLRSHFSQTSKFETSIRQNTNLSSRSNSNMKQRLITRTDTEFSTDYSSKSTRRNDQLLPLKDIQHKKLVQHKEDQNQIKSAEVGIIHNNIKGFPLRFTAVMFSHESDQEEEDEYLVTDYSQKINDDDNYGKIKSNKFTFHGNFTDRTSSVNEAEGPMTSRFAEITECLDERGSYCEQNMLIPQEGVRMMLNESQRKILLTEIKAF